MKVQIYLLGAAMAISTMPSAAMAQSSGTKIDKIGSTCPSGFKTSGSSCVSTGGKSGIQRIGSCPSTFKTSGDYCVGTSNSSYAEVKKGSCPSGLKTSGKYCIK